MIRYLAFCSTIQLLLVKIQLIRLLLLLLMLVLILIRTTLARFEECASDGHVGWLALVGVQDGQLLQLWWLG